MANFTVYGGTAKGGKNLCATCQHAHVRRGYAESQEFVLCGLLRMAPDPVVHWPVYECTDFLPKGHTHKEELEKIALLVDGTHIRHEGFGRGK